MDWLYDLIRPFLWNAGRVFAVAAGFLALYAFARVLRARGRGSRTWPLVVVAAAWTLFGVLEVFATRQHANIRVDLLLTWPALCLVTVAGLVLWLHSLARARR